ncbi:hypothetical protein BH11ARM2_BH11ARM2_10460 [soil metagenome]
MMKKTLMASLAVAGALALTLLAARPALAQSQEKEEDEKTEMATGKEWPPTTPMAKITPIQAIAVAKKKLAGGTAFEANFEFDEGHWVYGVMIVKGHKISEVEVDPISGKALDSETVTPDDEAAEATEMLKKVAAAGG